MMNKNGCSKNCIWQCLRLQKWIMPLRKGTRFVKKLLITQGGRLTWRIFLHYTNVKIYAKQVVHHT